MSSSSILLRNLLVETKDGEWGKAEPFDGSVEMAVIRGTDFDTAKKSGLEGVPVRHIAGKAAGRKTLQPLDILIETAGGSKGKPTGKTTFLRPALFERSVLPITCASFARFLRIDATLADPEFVYWCLQSLYLSGVIETYQVQHTGIARFQFTKFADSLEINLPPIGDQIKISAFLGSIENRISLLRETNATLEAIAQALFKSWFVDFDPVRAKAEGLEPEGMDAATAALFPDSFEESELGLVPREWRVDRADCWLSVLETGRRPKGGVSGIMDGVPSIGAESIVRIGAFDYSKTKYVSAEFFEKMKSGGLQSHDVLLYKDGGKPGVFLPRVSMFGDGFPFEKCGINEHVFRIRLKEPFNQAFLYYWLWSDAVMHELRHRGGKAAIPGINQTDVKELKLLVPDKHVLMRFDEITSPLINTIFSNSKQAQTLTQLRDTLLPRLISGQLRLPEAEAQLEEVCA